MYRSVFRSRVVRLLFLTGIWTAVSSVARADWPTYRGDGHRSGVCEEELQLPLVESWTHAPSLPPQPAWPEMPAKRDVYREIHGLSPTTIFDRAFHPVIEGGSLYYGSSADVWRWEKSDKCGTISSSAGCMFSRFSNPRMFDLASGEFSALTSVTRSGCWINILPAGGMVLIPEASSGCTCYYSMQTSLALTPRDGKP